MSVPMPAFLKRWSTRQRADGWRLKSITIGDGFVEEQWTKDEEAQQSEPRCVQPTKVVQKGGGAKAKKGARGAKKGGGSAAATKKGSGTKSKGGSKTQGKSVGAKTKGKGVGSSSKKGKGFGSGKGQ